MAFSFKIQTPRIHLHWRKTKKENTHECPACMTKNCCGMMSFKEMQDKAIKDIRLVGASGFYI